MIIRPAIKLPDIDEYVQEVTAIAEKANMALALGLRARMAVSVGAQVIAYTHLAQAGTLLAEIYQAGDAKRNKLNSRLQPSSRS